MSRLVVLALLSSMAGCGDDPVAYSETISIRLSGIKNGDIANGQASEDKNINSEVGNPYAAFLKNARERLGRDPGLIEIVSATVRVHADSKNISSLDVVFADMELFMADSATTIPFAHRATISGSSLGFPIDDDVDYEPIAASMLGGDFKVGARGATVALPPDDFDLKLTLDLEFEAFE